MGSNTARLGCRPIKQVEEKKQNADILEYLQFMWYQQFGSLFLLFVVLFFLNSNIGNGLEQTLWFALNTHSSKTCCHLYCRHWVESGSKAENLCHCQLVHNLQRHKLAAVHSKVCRPLSQVTSVTCRRPLKRKHFCTYRGKTVEAPSVFICGAIDVRQPCSGEAPWFPSVNPVVIITNSVWAEPLALCWFCSRSISAATWCLRCRASRHLEAAGSIIYCLLPTFSWREGKKNLMKVFLL